MTFLIPVMKSLFILLLLMFTVWLYGQPVSFLHHMKQDSACDVYLRLDWKNLLKNKKEKVYQDATLCCRSSPNDSLTMNAKVRTRGHMRLDICDYPPLKLKIDKSDLSRNQLSNFNELDIVNRCQVNEFYQQLILKEFLCYKLWELVSPYYLKTQLIRLHCQDTTGRDVHETSIAFLVEDPEEMCNRLGGKNIKNEMIRNSALERQPFLRLSLFEFMIGNTDWYIANRHNIEFIGIPGHTLLITVPYDFDYSGLVQAPYAAPNETIKTDDVSIRFYQGLCHTEPEVRGQLQVFLDQKEKILQMPYQIQGLNEKSIRQTIEYLQGFYDVVENPKKFKSQVLEHCDMWGN